VDILQLIHRCAVENDSVSLNRADTRPAVFLVEEPEALPQAPPARYFAGTLRQLAELGNDVRLTTP
jgi:hypothetical protein